MKTSSHKMLRALVVTALMIALEVILHRLLSIKTPLVVIHFGFLPIAVVAIASGPWLAGGAWAMAEILGAILFPTGAYFPGFTVTALIMGILFGIFFHRKARWWKVVLCITVVSVVCTLLLDSLCLMMIYDKTALLKDFPSMIADEWFIGFASGRLLKTAVMFPIQILFVMGLGGVIQRTGVLAPDNKTGADSSAPKEY